MRPPISLLICLQQGPTSRAELTQRLLGKAKGDKLALRKPIRLVCLDELFPLSRRALLSALTLAWSRALGEFGATILVAGNLPRKTQTMTLLVYAALERDLHACFTVAILLLAMAAVALGAVRYLARLDRAELNA